MTDDLFIFPFEKRKFDVYNQFLSTRAIQYTDDVYKTRHSMNVYFGVLGVRYNITDAGITSRMIIIIRARIL